VAYRISLVCVAFLLSMPCLAVAREYCPSQSVTSDASAEMWVIANGPYLQYPAADFYAYGTGTPQPVTRENRPMSALFPPSMDVRCPGDARFCIASAVWSVDRRFIAIAAGDDSNRSSPEILVARVSDRVVWRASTPEALLDIGEFDPSFYGFVGWPAWTSATGLQYTRCAPNGRFDIIMTLGSRRDAQLPDWFAGGQSPPVIAAGEINAGNQYRAFDPDAYDPGRGYITIAFDKGSNTTFVSSGRVAGSVNGDGVLNRWMFLRASSRHYRLAQFGAPHAVASGPPGELYAATDPRNVFESSIIYGVTTNGKSTPFVSWDWNPVALAYDERRRAIFVADPYANVIYLAKRGVRPQFFSGRCETLYDGAIDAEVAQLCRGGDADGPAAIARFNQPQGLAYDAQDRVLYVADTGNNEIRGIRDDGSAFTLAGACVRIGDDPNCLGSMADGRGASARFSWPMGIVYDAKSRSLIVADTFNNKIRRVQLDGTVTTLAGSGVSGQADGIGLQASFYRPAAIALDDNRGDFLVVDRASDALRRIGRDGAVKTFVKPLF
jgi:DNA-binding beta-propeller fold protein YncE